MERLQKYLSECGVASRRAAENIILEGRVTVNGETAMIGLSVNPETDVVLVDGKPVKPSGEKIVVILNKPKGVICSMSDPEGRKTVGDCVTGISERLYHVGRLDINTEGLILLTNDGALANRLMHPRFGVVKTYVAVCDGILTAAEAVRLANGVELEDGMTAPARVSRVQMTKDGNSLFRISIREGRNRQVRRMIEGIGHRTLALKREKYGPLSLDGLKTGEWRVLNPEEVESLRNAAGKSASNPKS